MRIKTRHAKRVDFSLSADERQLRMQYTSLPGEMQSTYFIRSLKLLKYAAHRRRRRISNSPRAASSTHTHTIIAAAARARTVAGKARRKFAINIVHSKQHSRMRCKIETTPRSAVTTAPKNAAYTHAHRWTNARAKAHRRRRHRH